jgi:hypothetical protein
MTLCSIFAACFWIGYFAGRFFGKRAAARGTPEYRLGAFLQGTRRRKGKWKEA